MRTYETRIKDNGDLRYKIQLRCVSGVWQQRHIWYPPTPNVRSPTAEPWIRSTQSGNPGFGFELVQRRRGEGGA